MDCNNQMRSAFFISGGGTTMRAILRAKSYAELDYVKPALLVASKDSAGGIGKAKEWGMSDEDIVIINPRDYETEEAFGEVLIAACRARSIDYIGQYGWLPKTPANVVEEYIGRIVNQHPGPLRPGHLDFGGKGMYGRRVHAARLLFVRATGRSFFTEAVAHRVTNEFDKGAVIHKERVDILDDDDVISLQKRVLEVEHLVQIETIRRFSLETANDLSDQDPLILPGEESLLEEAKQAAGFLFPNG